MTVQHHQQINLYRPIFRRETVPFSAKAMLTSTLLLSVGLVLLYGLELYNLENLNKQLKNLSLEQTKKMDAIEKLNKAIPVQRVDASLEDKIKALDIEKGALEFMLDQLGTKAFGNRVGFSPYIKALAQEPFEGLWLYQIDLEAGGSRIGIEGRSYQPEAVPAFLKQLEKQEVFLGSRFEMFKLARNEKDPTQLEFFFRSAIGEGEKVKTP